MLLFGTYYAYQLYYEQGGYMFKDLEMQMFYNDLINKGFNKKEAIKKTLITFRQQYIFV